MWWLTCHFCFVVFFSLFTPPFKSPFHHQSYLKEKHNPFQHFLFPSHISPVCMSSLCHLYIARDSFWKGSSRGVSNIWIVLPLSIVPLTLCWWTNITRILFFLYFHSLMLLENLKYIYSIYSCYDCIDPLTLVRCTVYIVGLINLLCFPCVSSSFGLLIMLSSVYLCLVICVVSSLALVSCHSWWTPRHV